MLVEANIARTSGKMCSTKMHPKRIQTPYPYPRSRSQHQPPMSVCKPPLPRCCHGIAVPRLQPVDGSSVSASVCLDGRPHPSVSKDPTHPLSAVPVGSYSGVAWRSHVVRSLKSEPLCGRPRVLHRTLTGTSLPYPRGGTVVIPAPMVVTLQDGP